MITLQEICHYLDRLLCVSDFKDYGPNGLQVQGNQSVKKIGTAVSASLETLEQAANEGVDCLIVHHGIFWDRDALPIVGTKKQKIDLLIQNNLSLLAYHLPLDAHEEYGNNWRVGKDLGWSSLEPFGESNGAYLGVRGVLNSVHRDQLVTDLSDYYGHDCQLVAGGPETIDTVACVSGGAHRLLLSAAKEGIDCFITGTVDEPVWHWGYEEKINFMAFGHSATERVGPKALGRHIEDIFQIPVTFIDVYNPF